MEDKTEAFRAFLTDWFAASGWSQFQLAMATGIGQSIISRWLSVDPKRRTQPTDDTLKKLAPAVGRSFEDLMRMAGRLEDAPSDREGLPPELSALMADLEAGWFAADTSRRTIGAQVVRSVFHTPRPQRPDRRRTRKQDIVDEPSTDVSEHNSDNDASLDKPNDDSVMQLVHASLVIM